MEIATTEMRYGSRVATSQKSIVPIFRISQMFGSALETSRSRWGGKVTVSDKQIPSFLVRPGLGEGLSLAYMSRLCW